MPVFILNKFEMLALIFILCPVIQVSASLLCQKADDRHFARDSFLYKTRRWEKCGDVYDTVFKVRRWKGLLPDGGALLKGGYSKKHVDASSPESLEEFVLESRRGELAHWLAIPPFLVFVLFTPPLVFVLLLVYAMAVNLPCVIAQRYNRPRTAKTLEGLKRREAAKSKKREETK